MNYLERAKMLRVEADEMERLANRPLPEKWLVGQRVEYIRDSYCGFNKGGIATIVKILEEYKDTPVDEYQVFYTLSDASNSIFWTTPDDVKLVE